MKPAIILSLLFMFLLTSCYDYNVDVVYSTYEGHLIIKKVTYEDQPNDDGFYYYKDSANALEQNLKLFLRAVDGNETLDPILWSENGKSFVFLFHGTISKLDNSTFKTKLVLFNVKDGQAINIFEKKDKEIVDYFFSDDSTFNYVCTDKPDTISVKIK
jgi:hypothetical protein